MSSALSDEEFKKWLEDNRAKIQAAADIKKTATLPPDVNPKGLKN